MHRKSTHSKHARQIGKPCSGVYLFAFVWLAFAVVPFASCQRSDDELIQRFRPFVKTSVGRPGAQSGDEDLRPASWKTIVAASVLVQNGQGVVSPQYWTPPNYPELTATFPGNHSASLLVDPTNKSQDHLQIPSSIWGGESWQQVSQGDGIYGHVQHIADTTLVNIEYWLTWALNKDEAKFNQHEGDITAIIVLYDTATDKIVRITYPAHGCTLAAYQLVPGQSVVLASLTGKDINLNSIQTAAAQVNIDDPNKGTDRETGGCGGAIAPNQHVFLVPDPVTHQYEHPALYAERGTHESFPNQGGFIALGGGHNGDSVSYLPAVVENFGSFNPAPGTATTDTNFIEFNGLFGSDLGGGGLPDSPAPIVAHSEWCWPPACSANSYGIPEHDINPYEAKLDNLTWLPTLQIAQTGDIYVGPGDASNALTGTTTSPFVDFAMAYSLTPAVQITPASPGTKWTIHVSNGVHPGPVTMDRAMTITSWNGPAIIGGQ